MRTDAPRFILLATIVAVAACGTDATAPEPAELTPEQERMEAAAAIGEATTHQVRVFMVDELSLPGAVGAWAGPGAAPPWASPGNCVRHPETRRFHCPPVTWQSMTVTRSFTPYDADGEPMETFDPLLTASVHFVGELAATGVRPNGASVEVAHTRDMTVSGLLGQETERTWNGTATSRVHTVFQNERGARTHTFDGALEVVDVVVAVPRTEQRWPLSGTMTHEGTTTATLETEQGTRTQTRSYAATVTFNGTHLVPLVINGRELRLDLSTGRIVR